MLSTGLLETRTPPNIAPWLADFFKKKVWSYASFAAPADSPAHLCDASNPAPGFVCESTGRRHHWADATDQKMGSRFFTPPTLLALPPRPNLSFEAKSLRGCLDTAANALARKSIAAYPSSVNTGKRVLPHRSSISTIQSERVRRTAVTHWAPYLKRGTELKCVTLANNDWLRDALYQIMFIIRKQKLVKLMAQNYDKYTVWPQFYHSPFIIYQ